MWPCLGRVEGLNPIEVWNIRDDFISCMKLLRAERMTFHQFHRIPLICEHQISVAKYRMNHAEYVKRLVFVFPDVAQLRHLLWNDRDFPDTTNKVEVQFHPDSDEDQIMMLEGTPLAETLAYSLKCLPWKFGASRMSNSISGQLRMLVQ